MKLFSTLIISLLSATAFAQFSFINGNAVGCSLNELDTAFIVSDINSGSIKYTSSLESVPNFFWKRYYAPGVGIVNENITTYTTTGNTTTIETADLGEGGYILEYDSLGVTATRYIWITNHERYRSDIDSIGVYNTGKIFGLNNDFCSNLVLKAYFSDTVINYYTPITITEYAIPMTRDVEYKDNTRALEDKDFKQNDTLYYNTIAAPYDDTQFEAIVYDKFLTAQTGKDTLQSAKRLRDSVYLARAVKFDGINYTVLEDSLATNEIEQSSNGRLGGSAPLEVLFSANNVSSKVEYYDWNIRKNIDNPGNPIYFTEPEIRHTFRDKINEGEAQGDYYTKLVISNDYCSVMDSVEVTIIKSFIDAPNFMIIGGEVPEFRVVYKSLKTFKGYIYNRWGRKLFEWDDPARGWDMKHRGKFVSPGVYYYVIRAKGTDGISQNKSGSITLIRPKK